MATAPKIKAAPSAAPDLKPGPDVDPPEAAQLPADEPPTDEETETADEFGVTVAALRAIRAAGPVATVAASRSAKAGDPICGACWPAGWPDESADFASCEHGEWTR